MEEAIGEIITLPDGRKAEVVEAIVKDSCRGCILEFLDCYSIKHGLCSDFYRTDHKNIIYREIKE